ncbi:cation:proton antiporter [Devosia aurantiaca]|uniref:Sodium:proton antiporter n=1 Tax=Devosia aurantiaca TaxID=2714858 RepID=A0A6M1SH90_9HYPH|nr:cation:proton antiporter [Devosia aurantiaca]NGP16540.1 sodium:proton antiporter [Devosia aurantiaca]
MIDWSPDPYIVVLTAAGVLIALVAWLPLALRRLPISLPIICILIGAVIFGTQHVGFDPSPGIHPYVTERLTEFVVIIALMGAGLKIDRVFSFKRWGMAWRLLLVTMPLSILAIIGVGHLMLGLGVVASLLLAASLAATTGEEWFTSWLTYNVIWEIVAGIGCGWLVGRVFGWLTFKMPGDTLAKTGDGLIAIAATFISYGVSELIHCYGFFAVFVTALTLRSAHRDHEFQRDMHDITEQVERIAMMVLLLAFGGSLISGLLWVIGWTEVLAALLILLVVRPAAGLIGLIGAPATLGERITIAFFGIRGVGSFYYLAYGLNHGEFDEAERLWAILSLVVLISVVMHGLTVTPIMR